MTVYSKIVDFKKRFIKKRIIPERMAFIIDNFFNNFHNLLIISKDLTRDALIISKDLTRDALIISKDLTRDAIIQSKNTIVATSVQVKNIPFKKQRMIYKLKILLSLPISFVELLYAVLTIKPVTKEIDQANIKNINQICVNSRNVQNRVLKYYDRDSLVVHPPIETEKYQCLPSESYWLSVNRITPDKRIKMQIEAFNALGEKLIIVGGCDNSHLRYANELKSLAKNNIIFLENLTESDLKDLYAKCQGFIATSIDEDFGMTAVEAMASGKPVIAPKEGGYQETIIPNETGFLIDDINSEKIIDTVRKINDELKINPLKYQEACQTQAKNFNLEKFTNKIDQLLHLEKKQDKKNNTAVAIFSFNRPHYLKQVLDSLEKNSDLDGLDFYFFQDGLINKFSKRITANESDIKKCLALWESCRLPNKRLIRRHFNLGIGINQFEAKTLLFDELNYEQVMFFEDDMILSQEYIRLLKIMLSQFKNDPDISLVMANGGHPNIKIKEKRKQAIYKLRTGNDNLWGWATWQDRWKKAKPLFAEYYPFIENIDYKYRPIQEIINFFAKKNIKTNVSSQDQAMKYAFIANDMIELNTFIPRGKYIGEIGTHMYTQAYKRYPYHEIILNEFEEDKTLTQFEAFDKKHFFEYSKEIFLHGKKI